MVWSDLFLQLKGTIIKYKFILFALLREWFCYDLFLTGTSMKYTFMHFAPWLLQSPVSDPATTACLFGMV